MKTEVVVWLVRDTLRVSDNPALQRACQIAQSKESKLVALACLEPRRWAGKQFGLPRIGDHWARFRAQSIFKLRKEMEALDAGLWLSAKEPIHAINWIHQQYSVAAVVCDDPVATEERLEIARLESDGYLTCRVYVDDLFRPEQLPFKLDKLPATFSGFRKLIEATPNLSPDRPINTLPTGSWIVQPWEDPIEWHKALDIPLYCNKEVPLLGGSEAAYQHWNAYLDARALSHYKETRNEFYGPMQSSHLSAWLSHGCISPRKIWWDTLHYEEKVESNESTYWLRFELLWREYFRWYSRNTDRTLFRKTGPRNRLLETDQNHCRFDMWKRGQTGCDIVDAAIRELNYTGWISNRARQLVASHLIYEFDLDWRLGAAYFESQLVDYDVASNWGNWAYIAGLGPDPRGGRIFNLNNQANRYDPKGFYRNRWLS